MPLVLEPSWTGRRVSIRRVAEPVGAPRYSDVVGDLLDLDERIAVVETRTGMVEVPVASIAVARLAPASPADELALEAVAARGWRPAEIEPLGGWLLRANDGFTSRGNSVLPLRTADRPLTEALSAARAWYAARGLPLRIQVPIQARRLLDAELGARGWAASPDVHVMAARLDRLPGESVPAVTVTATPDDDWFGCYRDGAGATAAAQGLLLRHDTAGFASIRSGERVLAIGRGAVDDGWLGVTAVEVVPDERRRGLAGRIMRALHDWGRDRGARRVYLQVSPANAAGVGLYRSLGYWVHHDYRYRLDPDG
jgi:GNAT superfamily N-acetyltransferase